MYVLFLGGRGGNIFEHMFKLGPFKIGTNLKMYQIRTKFDTFSALKTSILDLYFAWISCSGVRLCCTLQQESPPNKSLLSNFLSRSSCKAWFAKGMLVLLFLKKGQYALVLITFQCCKKNNMQSSHIKCMPKANTFTRVYGMSLGKANRCFCCCILIKQAH